MNEPQRYESIKHLVSVTGFVLDVVILIYLLTSGASIRLREFAESHVQSEFAIIAVYTLLVGAIFKAFELPLAVYSGHDRIGNKESLLPRSRAASCVSREGQIPYAPMPTRTIVKSA